MKTVCLLDTFVAEAGRWLVCAGEPVSPPLARVALLRIELPVSIRTTRNGACTLIPVKCWSARCWQPRVYRLTIEWPTACANETEVYLEDRLLRRYRSMVAEEPVGEVPGNMGRVLATRRLPDLELDASMAERLAHIVPLDSGWRRVGLIWIFLALCVTSVCFLMAGLIHMT